MHPNAPAALRQVERDGAAESKGRSGDKRDRSGSACSGMIGCDVKMDWLGLFAADYTSGVAFGELTNLTALEATSNRKGTARGALFRARVDVIPSTMVEEASREVRGA